MPLHVASSSSAAKFAKLSCSSAKMPCGRNRKSVVLGVRLRPHGKGTDVGNGPNDTVCDPIGKAPRPLGPCHSGEVMRNMRDSCWLSTASSLTSSKPIPIGAHPSQLLQVSTRGIYIVQAKQNEKDVQRQKKQRC